MGRFVVCYGCVFIAKTSLCTVALTVTRVSRVFSQDHGRPHFQNVKSDDVTDEVIEEGARQHMLFRAGDIKKRVTLTAENFFQRCEIRDVVAI